VFLLLGLVVAALPFVLPIVSLVRQSGLLARIHELEHALGQQQREIDALKAKLYRCWNPPVAVREASSLVVAVRITLLPDGSLSGEPQMVGIKEASNPLAQVAIEAAIRAVVQCAPFGDVLKPENYALWNQIDFIFDPREMLGG